MRHRSGAHAEAHVEAGLEPDAAMTEVTDETRGAGAARRRGVGAGIVALALAAIVVWSAIDDGGLETSSLQAAADDGQDATPEVIGGTRPVGSFDETPAWFESAAVASEDVSADVIADASTAAKPDRSADQIEVCGVGWVDAEPDASLGAAAIAALPGLAAAERRLDDRMRGSADPFAAAMSSWLSAGNEAAVQAASAQLVRRAVSSRDPRLYGSGIRACLSEPQIEAACKLLSAEQWALLDAGNAVPWLYLFDAAAARGDAAAADEALFRLSTAARLDEGGFAAAAVVVAQAGNDDGLDLLAAWARAQQAIGRVKASPAPPLQSLGERCAALATGAADRHDEPCSAIARLLIDHADSFRLRLGGLALAARLGWDAERLAGLREETADWQAQSSAPQRLGCAELRDTLVRWRRAAAVGEVTLGRELASAGDALNR